MKAAFELPKETADALRNSVVLGASGRSGEATASPLLSELEAW